MAISIQYEVLQKFRAKGWGRRSHLQQQGKGPRESHTTRPSGSSQEGSATRGGNSASSSQAWGSSRASGWVAGATWASSTWQAWSCELVVAKQESTAGGCHTDVVKENHFLLYAAAFFILLITAVSFFSIGWFASDVWHGRSSQEKKERLVVKAAPSSRAKKVEKQTIGTQCRIRSSDLKEIERLTIDSIREDLICYGEYTRGFKAELALRLQKRLLQEFQSPQD